MAKIKIIIGIPNVSTIKDFINWLTGKNRCELCKGYLRRKGDIYHGGIRVSDTIGLSNRTAYICNLCYFLNK